LGSPGSAGLQPGNIFTKMCNLSKYSNIATLSLLGRWYSEMEEAQKARLTDSFGERAAKIIIAHENELDETFGSAAVTIKKVMNGDASRD
jgi:hypothetical protein